MKTQFRIWLSSLALVPFMTLPVLAGDRLDCDDIQWKQDIVKRFEGIQSACQEVVVRNGDAFVRFEVEFVRVLTDGGVEVLMTLQDGRRVKRVFEAPEDFQAESNSGMTDFHMEELVPGDMLDVFIPANRVSDSEPAPPSV